MKFKAARKTGISCKGGSVSIEHLIVLMMENRSFDHMLGYLDHPDSSYPRLSGQEFNNLFPGTKVKVSDQAEAQIIVDPDHSHSGMMRAMYGIHPDEHGRFDYERKPNQSGFAWLYEEQTFKETKKRGQGEIIMRCFKPKEIPVLSTLAKEFAVCTRWFCSVPGATWPNRSFLHSATSEGQVDNKYRPYRAKTIFEQCAEHQKSWRIYHDGMAHAMVYPALWNGHSRENNFFPLKDLYKDIKKDKLPSYTFIEPDHFGIDSSTQHPANNTRSWHHNGRGFRKGEQLIANIYNALKAKPEVFNKTLFVITYDESGGFYDREIPPHNDSALIPNKKDINKSYGFKFDMLGPRVPAVLVSPWIKRGTIDNTIYDHTSVIRSIRELFFPEAAPLSNRDKQANHFLGVLSEKARTKLPSVKPLPVPKPVDDEEEWDDFNELQDSMVDLSIDMNSTLDSDVWVGEGDDEDPWWGLEPVEKRKSFKSKKEMYKYSKFVAKKFNFG